VQAAEDAWNTCDPERVAGAYTPDSQWRNHEEFFEGRDAIVDFLRRKWSKELRTGAGRSCGASPTTGSRCGSSTSHDPGGQWWRSHGNEHWEFDELGYMRRRDASINDYRIDEADRRIHVDRG